MAIAKPAPEVLQKYFLGQLPLNEAAPVEAYLAKAEDEPLSQTVLPHDTLIQSIRAGASVEYDFDPTHVQRQTVKLKQLRSVTQQGEGEATRAPGHDDDFGTLGAVGLSFLSPAQEDDEIGRLGKYRVLQILGEGGMGIVFRAEDTQLRRLVALKVMKLSAAEQPESRQRFLREARATAALKDDHIVTIFEVEEDRAVPYLAMELLAGMSLESLLKKKSLTIAQCVRLGQEIAEGLAVAHEHELIHRDIKPANIWLETVDGHDAAATGRVKLLDFGLARSVKEDVQLTKTGMIMGTPAYMPPEQADGRPVDGRSDLFSLGCVLYRMCTGQLPFRGETTVQVLCNVAMNQPPHAGEVNPALPDELAALIMTLLAKDPNNRPASARDVAKTLQEIDDILQTNAATATVTVPATECAGDDNKTAGGTTTIPFAPLSTPTNNRRRFALFAVAAVILVALVGVIIWQLVQLNYRTPHGAFVVEINDKAIEARLRNGKIELYDMNGQLQYTLSADERNTKLPPGQYRMKVVSHDGVELYTEQFTMKKNGAVTVRVRPRPIVLTTAKSERRWAEWIVEIGGSARISFDEKSSVDVFKLDKLPKTPFHVTGLHTQRSQDIRNDDLQDIKHLTHLYELLMPKAPIDDRALYHIEGIHTLSSLDLTQTKVSDAGMISVAKAPTIYSLNLSETVVGDTGAAHLAGLKNLNELNLSKTKLTVAGLQSVTALKSLRRLRLAETALTGDATKHLSRLRKLEYLDVRGIKFTLENIRHLEIALPMCKIVHSAK